MNKEKSDQKRTGKAPFLIKRSESRKDEKSRSEPGDPKLIQGL